MAKIPFVWTDGEAVDFRVESEIHRANGNRVFDLAATRINGILDRLRAVRIAALASQEAAPRIS